MKKLNYSIYKCSSFTVDYDAENIKVPNSSESTSTLSSENNIPPQYLILKLENTSIVKTITFGKYEVSHVCNGKKFKVFGGLDADKNMIELIDGGLKNESVNETFELKHTLGNGMIPIRYIKIVPLVNWGISVNFTVWFVELRGVDDPNIIELSLKHFETYRENEFLRLCLKHFRERNYKNAFTALEQETKVKLEDPLFTEFYKILVTDGDYDKAETFLDNIAYMGLFSDYIKQREYLPIWEQIDMCDDTQIRPGMRGGHQMCIDPYSNAIYLFGGWDGSKDLNDLWIYNINTMKWVLLSSDVSMESGPSPRSCHKMCLDTKTKQIFLLGRYLDVQYRQPDNQLSDFYVYDIESKKWQLLAEDTKTTGGPSLIFDHQMCMDIDKRTLYVFGGRILSLPAQNAEGATSNDVLYSGLYSFNVCANIWRQLVSDDGLSWNSSNSTLIARAGHSMLFHPINRKLYVFAGQRNKEYLNDFISYHVDTHTVEPVYNVNDLDVGNFPASGFTQRATIDPETDEIFVFSGLSKDKIQRDNVQNSLWVFKIRENKWICIYNNENSSEAYWKKARNAEPCPRFAHQLVYDNITKTHYLFGGNPGRQISPKLRLDDFWKLQMNKPTQEELLHRSKFLIRKHNFEELTRTDSIAAVTYMRTKLSEIIDHQDPKQTKEFHSLSSLIFQKASDLELETEDEKALSNISKNMIHYKRSKLFEQLVIYFPADLTQPRENISDLITL